MLKGNSTVLFEPETHSRRKSVVGGNGEEEVTEMGGREDFI